MREAPARVLMEYLWENGASVQAFDPEATEEARHLYPDQERLKLCDSPEEALQGCHALAVVTEWNVFRSPSFDLLKKEVADAVIFDGRNLYDPQMVKNEGFTYYAIGRGTRAVD